MATNFVSYRTWSLGAEVSQYPLDRFSQSLHRMVCTALQMITTFYFFDILSDVAMATNLVAKWGKITTPRTYRSVIQKRYGITQCMCKIK